MTKDRARQLLREIWGGGRNVTLEEIDEIHAAAAYDGEPQLTSLQRIAEDDYEWRIDGAFSKAAFAHFANLS